MKLRDLKYMLGYQKIIKVDDRLSRGSALFTPIRAARLKLKGFEQVIDLRASSIAGSSLAKKLEKFYCKCFNIKYINIPIQFTNESVSANSFQRVTDKLNENNLKTFIHCHYGRHRTGESVAFYQLQNNCKEEEIIQNLLDNGWNKKEDFLEASYKNLIMFLKKYFPAKKNFEKVEEYRKYLFTK